MAVAYRPGWAVLDQADAAGHHAIYLPLADLGRSTEEMRQLEFIPIRQAALAQVPIGLTHHVLIGFAGEEEITVLLRDRALWRDGDSQPTLFHEAAGDGVMWVRGRCRDATRAWRRARSRDRLVMLIAGPSPEEGLDPAQYLYFPDTVAAAVPLMPTKG